MVRELRNYQKEAVDIIDNLESGSHLVQMATGLGKTVTFASIKRKGRILILSHRDELVHQPAKYYDCSFGVEQADEHSNGEEVISASVQSLVKRLDRFPQDYFDTIITDEAHHAVAKTYRTIYDHFTPRLHLGFTATPNRGDKIRLDEIYEDIVFQRDLLWGIKNKYLCNINCMRVNVKYDISKVKRRMGDFQLEQLDKAVNNVESNEEVAKAYYKYAVGQTLIFTTSVEHAINISKEIEGSVVVDAKTKNRDEIINAFTERKFKCLINCMIFTEGTDIPLIETIMIVRPTQNVSLYTQMVGRGLRKYPGKKELTLIDCVGVTEELDICTAPSLLGLDIQDVPEERKENIEGMLTDLPTVINTQIDNPVSWKLSAKTVDLFAKKNHYNLRNINWTLCANGDLMLCFPENRLIVKAINEVGKTYLEYTSWPKRQYYLKQTRQSKPMTMEEAMMAARGFLENNFSESRNIWDKNIVNKWGSKKASEKQLNIIKKKLPDKECQLLDLDHMTKLEASCVLNKLIH